MIARLFSVLVTMAICATVAFWAAAATQEQLPLGPHKPARLLIQYCGSDEKVFAETCDLEISLLVLALFGGSTSKDGCGAFEDPSGRDRFLSAMHHWISTHHEFQSKTEIETFEAALAAEYPCPRHN